MPAFALSLGVRNTGPESEGHEIAPLASKDDVSPTTSNTVMWIVAAVIGGIIVIGSVSVYALIAYNKRRQYRRARELHPYLTHSEIVARRRKNEVGMFGDEEQRRRHMIRKSLATRSSGSGGSGLTLTAMMDQIDRELAQLEQRETTKLKDDWKEWEARMRRERSASGEQHPATTAPVGVPVLEVPTPAKHRSHGRTSFTSSPASPPLPTDHPGRLSPT